MEKINEILMRIRTTLGVKTDKQMCEKLGIAYGTLDNWKARKKIPKGKFLEIANKLKVSPEFLSGNGNFSNNTNSVIVNGSNNGNIINSHQVSVSNELMEVIELFKEYGNAKILSKFKNELLKLKETTDG